MSLSVHIFIKADTLFIRLSGELDHHTSIHLRDRINSLTDKFEIRNMVFNLKNLQFMDSSGIGVILGRYQHVKQKKGHLIVCELNAMIEKIIQLSGLLKILIVTKDEDQASSYLGVA
ncbi:MAG TPA: anti-sigma F factor antagonist [Haloplasmataceae bacterium]